MHGEIRVLTFNVCGIKNLFSFKPWNEERNLASTFGALGADIICFQETKLQSQDLRKEWAIVPGYQSFFTFSSARKGYSGVAMYVRDSIPVLAAEEGLTGWLLDLGGRKTYRDAQLIGGYPEINQEVGRKIDQEGRALLLDIGAAVLIGLYCPANSTGDKTEYRTLFFELLDDRVRSLRNLGREVIVFGDINVSPSLPDSAKAQEELKKSRLVSEEFYAAPQRQIINLWLKEGFHDTTRELHPSRQKMYTCWDLRMDGRGANFGSRIDLIITSNGIECKSSDIMPDIYGSDHCPVYSDLKLDIPPFPQHYTLPLLSRKRNATFAGIQSFWGLGRPGVKGSSQVKAGEPQANLEQTEQSMSTKTLGDLNKTAPFKVTKKNSSKINSITRESKIQSVSSFFEKRTDVLLKAASKSSLDYDPQKTPLKSPKTQLSSWNDAFVVKPPLCYHKEDTKLVKCTKKGPNKGRSFWICSRPQGEENNMEFRCSFFKWA